LLLRLDPQLIAIKATIHSSRARAYGVPWTNQDAKARIAAGDVVAVTAVASDHVGIYFEVERRRKLLAPTA
jgi:hypothetical protein